MECRVHWCFIWNKVYFSFSLFLTIFSLSPCSSPLHRFKWQYSFDDIIFDDIICRLPSGCSSHVTIQWFIPTNITFGNYRIQHFGVYKDGSNSTHAYQGTTKTFRVDDKDYSSSASISCQCYTFMYVCAVIIAMIIFLWAISVFFALHAPSFNLIWSNTCSINSLLSCTWSKQECTYSVAIWNIFPLYILSCLKNTPFVHTHMQLVLAHVPIADSLHWSQKKLMMRYQ